MAPRILIKIASYRDAELIVTMASALQAADHPNDVRFAVVNQFDGRTQAILDPVRGDSRARIREMPWQQSRGLGYARHLTDEMYDGEEFTLQVDAHMRFAPGWDTSLVRQFNHIGEENTVLSTYPGPYESLANGAVRATPAVPHRIMIQGKDRFSLPSITGGHRTEPYAPGLLVGGCFQFAAGRATAEVPALAPVLIGDESVHSVLLYTHGYDVVVPEEVPLYHRYAKSKDWQGGAHTPWFDFRDTPDMWAEFVAMAEISLRVAFEVLGAGESVHLGVARPREKFLAQLPDYCLDGVALPNYGREFDIEETFKMINFS